MAAHMGCTRWIFFTNHGLCTRRKSVLFDILPRFLSSSSRLYTDDGSPRVVPKGQTKAEKISKAMRAYMERSRSHEALIKSEIADYEIGKRHLANMMGLDPDSLTDQEVRESVRYLLPSGLYDKTARPMLKHPYEIFPRRKAAQFGMDGRPFHFLFYTGMPNFYKLMYDVTWKLENLKKEEEKLYKKGLMEQEEEKKLSLYGSEWIGCDELAKRLVENVNEKNHHQFVVLMERFADHPLSYREEEFIMKYRYKLAVETFGDSVKPPKVDPDGREYMTKKGFRKSARAVVTVRAKGTGMVTVNGSDIEYFRRTIDREQILFPLHLTNKLGEVDVEAEVTGGGSSGKAGAIRHGLSRALTSFVDNDMVEKLRLAGLLTKDPRRRERKKPGQEKARKKFTWKKR